MEPEVERAAGVLGAPVYGQVPKGEVLALVAGETVSIPYRIYSPEPSDVQVEALPRAESLILHALLTRHHDGYVREHHVVALAGVAEEWVVPFIVQLLGEYVVEIHEVVSNALLVRLASDERTREVYRTFAAANEPFLKLTEARIASYWACYYRHTYLRKRPAGDDGLLYPAVYPAAQVMEAIRALG